MAQHLGAGHALLVGPLGQRFGRSLQVGRICRLMGIMLESGVPLLESLRLVRSSIRNSLFREVFEKLEEDVLNEAIRSSD